MRLRRNLFSGESAVRENAPGQEPEGLHASRLGAFGLWSRRGRNQVHVDAARGLRGAKS